MFFKIVLCLIVMCGCGYGENSNMPGRNIIPSEHYKRNRVFHAKTSLRISEAEIRGTNRIKRGIALVDEDFDVPPSHNGVRESDGIFDEMNFEKSLEENDDDVNKSSKTPNQSFTTEKFIKIETKRREVTNKKTSMQSADDVTESMQVKSTKVNSFTSQALTSELNGSGDGITQTRPSVEDGYISEVDGSGDEKTRTESPTEETLAEIDIEITDICLNTICVEDVSVQISEETSLVPEGTNLTLSCFSNNSTTYSLYWYRNNGSTYFLQMSGNEEQLHFNVPDTKTFHSGIYKCVRRINKNICCNVEYVITVYEVPLYHYHLLILGLVTAAAVVLCIFLSVRQTTVMKMYKKKFVKKHGDTNQFLL